MLSPAVATRVSEALQPALSPRALTLKANLRAATNKLAAKGLAISGRAVFEFAAIATDELRIRGNIIWAASKRAHASIVGRAEATTLADLRQLMASYMDQEHAKIRRATIDDQRHLLRDPAGPPHIQEELARVSRETLDLLNVEAAYYVDELNRQAAHTPQAGAVTINAQSIGAVQTGAYAVAHLNLDNGAGERLAAAVEQLRAAVQSNAEATAEQRVQIDDLAGDLVAAVRAETPNRPKITALFGGLATTVQTIASLQPAWTAVRDAAIAVGVIVGMS